ncbi:MAG: hypothetical protein N2053_03410, partial [Chitinispirillaceae bacterium]|nr:hypothetical protein [Chitinispirillaceae bacterium]
VQIETSSIPVESGASYRYYLKRSSNWKEVVLLWKDFYQPKWVTNPQQLDLKTVTKIKWQIQAKSGSGELWLDDIRLPGLYIDRPIPDGVVFPIAQVKKDIEIRILKNKSSQFSIYFYNSRNGKVQIELYTLDGRCIWRVVNSLMRQGEMIVPITKSLSKGGYLIKAIDGSGISFVKYIAIY